MLLSLFCATAIPARAQTSDADFQQAVAAYQQTGSTATAEKVIKTAAALPELPPLPEEARKHFIRGNALFKEAKSPDDYEKAINEFSQAIGLAPWSQEARYNRALAWEAEGNCADAIAALKLYLLFKLPEQEARAVQDKIYALEVKQELQQENLKGIDVSGIYRAKGKGTDDYHFEFALKGYQLIATFVYDNAELKRDYGERLPFFTATLSGRNFSGTMNYYMSKGASVTGKISTDNRTIEFVDGSRSGNIVLYHQ
jgi:tetratricopeptide (TPR) repeat protein